MTADPVEGFAQNGSDPLMMCEGPECGATESSSKLEKSWPRGLLGMDKPNELDQLESCAKLALVKMIELGIPVSSTNYTVWYSYYADSYPDLQQEIDRLLERGDRFSESLNEKLYTKFFGLDQRDAAVHSAMSDLENLVARLVSFVGETQSKTSSYGRILSEVGDKLGGEPGGGLSEIIGRIKEETHRMAQTFETVESDLSETSGSLTRLGDDLDKMEQQTLCDSLTGIANWKAFHDSLRHCVIDVAENGGPVSLLMIDLDHFSQFNDRYGRPTGDKVLALVARILSEGIERPSIAARYGGAEFVVILKQTDLEEAIAQAEEIRDTFDSHELITRHSGERFGQVTISIGASQYNDGESLAHFIQRSRRAVQSAKAQGHNRVVANGSDSKDAVTATTTRRAS